MGTTTATENENGNANGGNRWERGLRNFESLRSGGLKGLEWLRGYGEEKTDGARTGSGLGRDIEEGTHNTLEERRHEGGERVGLAERDLPESSEREQIHIIDYEALQSPIFTSDAPSGSKSAERSSIQGWG